MNKQKQIEEMSRHLCLSWKNIYDSCEQCSEKLCCSYFNMAEELVDAGYRKIPEGAMVISIAEYNDLKGLEKHFDDYLIKEIVGTRKETVNNFASRLKNHRAIEGLFPMHITRGIYKAICEAIDEIANEIKEGKV